MKKPKIVFLLSLLIFLFPSVNAQVVSETEIRINNEVLVEHSTAGSHTIEVTKGDSVTVIHTLTNYFDADWVNFEVTYSVVYGENLISNLDTSGLKGYWNRKGEWNNFEFHFVAEEVGRVWMVFQYNGTYWEEFPTSQPKTFSSIANFSSLKFEIVKKDLPFTAIAVVIGGFAIILAGSATLFYQKKRKSSK